jgi:hypothetical protein
VPGVGGAHVTKGWVPARNVPFWGAGAPGFCRLPWFRAAYRLSLP